MGHRHRLVFLLLLPTVAFALPPLDRDPSSYFVIGLRQARLKNLTLVDPGCNIGVNCAQPSPGSRCGTLRGKGLTIGAPGQVAADNSCAPGSFFQVFRNNASGQCEPGCADISNPGPKTDCTEGFTTPLLGDLDGDTVPSCDSSCQVDLDDIAVACSVMLPFPACDPGHPVSIGPGGDCNPPADDLNLGNNQCDLKAGTYGKVTVSTGSTLVFEAGETVICSLFAGMGTTITASGPATVLVPGKGQVRLGNDGDHGAGCGVLRIVAENGNIVMGKNSSIDLDACTLGGKLKLGHGNELRGHFVGDFVASNRGNTGECCPAETTTTTTTITTTSTTATTTTTTSPPFCGDEILQTNEQCDPPGSLTCPDPNLPDGALVACLDGCLCPTSTTTTIAEPTTTSTTTTMTPTTTTVSIPFCGNNVVEQGEECDPPGSFTCPGAPTGPLLECGGSCFCPS